jgi:hypothetical protein
VKTHTTIAIFFAVIGFLIADYMAFLNAKRNGAPKYGGLFCSRQEPKTDQ